MLVQARTDVGGRVFVGGGAESGQIVFDVCEVVKQLGGWNEPYTPCYLKFLRFF